MNGPILDSSEGTRLAREGACAGDDGSVGGEAEVTEPSGKRFASAFLRTQNGQVLRLKGKGCRLG